MLSNSYGKIIDCSKRVYFPVYLKGDENFQATLEAKYLNKSLFYQLEYIEGETLHSYLSPHHANEKELINKINQFISWFESHLVYHIDGMFLLINGDSNPANIILRGDSSFTHIDNQTDFLFLTESLERVYYPVFKILDNIKASESFVFKLKLEKNVQEIYFNREASDLSLSEISDRQIKLTRDELYMDYFLGKKQESTLLFDLLISNPAKYKKLFPASIFEVLKRDFKFSEVFYLKHLSSDLN